jgi:hypothetical protein
MIRGGEKRPAKPGKSVQWTDLSVERRELGRAAGELSKSCSKPAARGQARREAGTNSRDLLSKTGLS